MAEQPIRQAQFDSKLRVYLFLGSVGLLIVTVVGILFLPIWLFLGWWWSGRYFQSFQCDLTERRLRIRRGVIFRKDKTIMLDKIQDMSLQHGPIQRWMGITTLEVETAGNNGPQGKADAKLTGIVDAQAFQEAVIAQRDRIAGQGPTPASASIDSGDASMAALLTDIRDSLHRVERRMTSS